MSEIPPSGRVYTRNLLALYDVGVHRVSNHLIWRCPTQRLITFYTDHLSSHHLDIGVATGFLLDHSTFPTPHPSLTLVDINPTCLQRAKTRLARYNPRVLHGDVLTPLPLPTKAFGSIGLGYVMHCLPGSMEEKSVAFTHLRPLLKDHGVLFGTTVLGAGLSQPWLTRRMLALYTRIGAFSNAQDDAQALEHALSRTFARFTLEIVGSVALFAGYV